MVFRLRHLIGLFILGAASLLGGCSLVDDDLSQCDSDCSLDYQLRLVTNITTELQTELGLQADLEMKGKLEDYFKTFFTDYATDVDLSFYDTEDPMPRLFHMSETMNGSESSFSLTLPVDAYRHTAVANIQTNGAVTLEDDDFCHSGRLLQHATEHLAPMHRTGLFTARKDLEVHAGKDENFDVRLYMANAASALVLDMSEARETVRSAMAVLTGMATEFFISDSTYVFDDQVLVSSDELVSEDGGTHCFASVHFPSRTRPESKVIIQIDGDDQTAGEPLWSWKVYCVMEDGSITESVLEIPRPVLPGHLLVMKGKVISSGAILIEDVSVTVTVTLDWDPGLEFPVPL